MNFIENKNIYVFWKVYIVYWWGKGGNSIRIGYVTEINLCNRSIKLLFSIFGNDKEKLSSNLLLETAVYFKLEN